MGLSGCSFLWARLAPVGLARLYDSEPGISVPWFSTVSGPAAELWGCSVNTEAVDASVVRASGLSKGFAIYNKPQDVLARLFSRRSRPQEFWAFVDVSFELRRGEV